MYSFKSSTLLSIISLTSLVAAIPQPIPDASVTSLASVSETNDGIISPTLGTAIHGALDNPIPTEPARLVRDLQKRVNAGPEYLTISIVNSHGMFSLETVSFFFFLFSTTRETTNQDFMLIKHWGGE